MTRRKAVRLRKRRNWLRRKGERIAARLVEQARRGRVRLVLRPLSAWWDIIEMERGS
jgi:hypothetical protein